MGRNKHYTYNCPESNNFIDLYHVDLELDFHLLYDWMHHPHVAQFWQLNKAREELLQHFKHELGREHQELFILAINHQLVAYAETYLVAKDRIADFYPHQALDYGLHLLIGEKTALGHGYSKLIIRALSDYLFKQHNARRVIVEPNVAVKQLEVLHTKLGFSHLGKLHLAEKTANLYAINQEQFYLHNPSKIGCNITNWPIVRLHFPSYPSDTSVQQWLNKLDSIIERGSPCVAISTFEANYQFSQNARKLEMKWFKANKTKLSQLCLGMIKVTTDAVMIKKLQNPAMEKGMPFRCRASPSLKDAIHIAHNMILKAIASGVKLE